MSFYGAGYRSRTGDFSMARRRVAATPNPQKAASTVDCLEHVAATTRNTQSLLLEHPPDSATGYTTWKAIILLLNYECL